MENVDVVEVNFVLGGGVEGVGGGRKVHSCPFPTVLTVLQSLEQHSSLLSTPWGPGFHRSPGLRGGAVCALVLVRRGVGVGGPWPRDPSQGLNERQTERAQPLVERTFHSTKPPRICQIY